MCCSQTSEMWSFAQIKTVDLTNQIIRTEPLEEEASSGNSVGPHLQDVKPSPLPRLFTNPGPLSSLRSVCHTTLNRPEGAEASELAGSLRAGKYASFCGRYYSSCFKFGLFFPVKTRFSWTWKEAGTAQQHGFSTLGVLSQDLSLPIYFHRQRPFCSSVYQLSAGQRAQQLTCNDGPCTMRGKP